MGELPSNIRVEEQLLHALMDVSSTRWGIRNGFAVEWGRGVRYVKVNES